ncbi:hypothetical protein D7Y41_35615 [Anaerotruncus sp. 1XD22-93]|nr:hypothetical protein [Lachnospiraceae bacterium]NBI77021.1 hypothetical protein [Lachnospiraceae bacterium]RKJ72174.1 hypothetical protein D7Y41_35615 [Anaerotruncus sp. 1XD22-93]
MAAKKRRRMSNAEKKERAEIKRGLQGAGIIPPDKPKLNRKKFIEEAKEEWNGRENDCFTWELYLVEALSYVMTRTESRSQRISQEAVGAAKALKLAIRLREFYEMLRKKGEKSYKLIDQYEYIKDILDA